jgi:hypothetical protein
MTDVTTSVTDPTGFALTTLVGKKWGQEAVLSLVLALHRLLSSDPVNTSSPIGLILTILVGSFYLQEQVTDCFLALYRKLGTPPLVNPPVNQLLLDFHFPDAPVGQQWQLVDNNFTDTNKPWWEGMILPFKCYSRLDMEKRAVCFVSATDTKPKEFREFKYAMDVSSINGVRFKVWQNPILPQDQLWVLAHMTQPNP